MPGPELEEPCAPHVVTSWPAHPLHPPLFTGATARVLSANRIDTMLDLDFGLTLRRVFQLKGFGTSQLGQDLHDAAKHCLITLAGSKKLLIRPEPRVRREWHAMALIPASVYLPVRAMVTPPVGYVKKLPDAHSAAIDLSTYMKWLATQRFDVRLVRDMLKR